MLTTAILGFYHWKYIAFVKTLISNIFTYFPNYLIHEFAHRIVGSFLFQAAYRYSPCTTASVQDCYPIANWLTTLAGNGVETGIPILLTLLALHIQGGKWLLPPLFYWTASTWYEAGIYVSDARASKLPLTSSDLLTNYAPGEVKGDWYHILEPLNLLEYDIIIGYIFYFLAMVFFVFSVYSAWYYWTHPSESYKKETTSPSYTVREAQITSADYETDHFAHLLPKDPSPTDKEDVNSNYPKSPYDPPF